MFKQCAKSVEQSRTVEWFLLRETNEDHSVFRRLNLCRSTNTLNDIIGRQCTLFFFGFVLEGLSFGAIDHIHMLICAL